MGKISNAQDKIASTYKILYHRVDSASANYSLNTEFDNVKKAEDYIKTITQLLTEQGFLAASIDSLVKGRDTSEMWLFLGPKYTWKEIVINDADRRLLNELDLSSILHAKKKITYSAIQQMETNVLDYYSDRGYPFASIMLDSVQLEKDSITAQLKIAKNGFYTIDSINVTGTAKINQNFIHRYLNMGKKEPYNLSKLKTINTQIQNLTYVSQERPWDITMANTGGMVNLYLAPKKVNQIDAIIGFLPANQEETGSNKMLVTGQVNLNLQNAFAAGESLQFNWQQLQARSPRLNFAFTRPYMFNSPYGLDLAFELYKKDSLFLNVYAKTGIQYALSNNQTGSVFMQFNSTRAISVDTATIISTKELPDVMDVSSVNVGVQYSYINTNYRLNPRRGNEFNVMILAGSRKISKNETILQISDPTFDYASLYDTVKLNSYQVKFVLTENHYFPIGRQATFKLGLHSGIFQTPSAYQNELFQIGGYKLLRGFDEESIYTNRYGVLTGEYRYLFGQNAYFFGFTDFGYAGYHVKDTKYNHTYLGVGGGMAFQTKAGILNISYAVGKRDDTKMNLQQAKIHIGFVSVF